MNRPLLMCTEKIATSDRKIRPSAAGRTSKPMVWRSKEFVLPPGERLGCARVMSEEPDAIAFTLIVDGVRVFSLAAGEVPKTGFRLPPLRGRRWQVEVGGVAKVERVMLASSMAEVSIS